MPYQSEPKTRMLNLTIQLLICQSAIHPSILINLGPSPFISPPLNPKPTRHTCNTLYTYQKPIISYHSNRCQSDSIPFHFRSISIIMRTKKTLASFQAKRNCYKCRFHGPSFPLTTHCHSRLPRFLNLCCPALNPLSLTAHRNIQLHIIHAPSPIQKCMT